ncbi:MAG: hypothetical protein MJA83_07425, partial [Gammaproteobacteria bacterium]|nr:hypothetical protein [Gammaproteobacteria bacterium]
MNGPSRRSPILRLLARALPSLLLLSSCSHDPRRADTDLLTRAELSDYRETSSYADVVDFLDHLAARSQNIHLTTFGYSSEGRPLPLAVIGATDATPEAVRETGKL